MYYVIDDDKNLKEALDKEGVFALLEKAIEDGTLENIVKDSAFVSKLKCCVSGQTNKVAFISQAKYNELKEGGLLETNALYFITDDTSCEDFETTIELHNERLTSLENRANASESEIAKIKNGETIVANASSSEMATSSSKATILNPTKTRITTATTFSEGVYVIRALLPHDEGTTGNILTFTIFVGTDSNIVYSSTTSRNTNQSDCWLEVSNGTMTFKQGGTPISISDLTMFYWRII